MPRYTEHEPWFRTWFGRSRVCTPGGLPLVVYHGTPAARGRSHRAEVTFEEFRLPEGNRQLGVHFGSRRQANRFGKPVAFHLRLENPLRLPDLGGWDYQNIIKSAREAGVAISDAEYDVIFEARDRNAMLRGLLLSRGYDGVIYENEVEGKGESFIAFQVDQIKPAYVPESRKTSTRTPARPAAQSRAVAIGTSSETTFAPPAPPAVNGWVPREPQQPRPVGPTPPAANGWRNQWIWVMGKPFRLGKVEGGKFYHGTGAVLAPGTILRPGKRRTSGSPPRAQSVLVPILSGQIPGRRRQE